MKRTLEDRFWSKVQKADGDGCWEWTGSLTHNGYGCFGSPFGTRAHRVSWHLKHGPIPNGLLVCHSCDNRKCVRPDHLFLGTSKQNTRDAVLKGRMNFIGEDNPRAKLTTEQALFIRSTRGPRREIAERFNIARSLVTHIRRGFRWGHLGTHAAAH